MAARRLMRRVRDISQRLPLSLDEAVARMVELRATDRYPSLAEAIEAVRVGRDPSPRVQAVIPNVGRVPLDADNLQPGIRIGTDYEIVTRLGQGGMAVVYAARHLVSGRTRALKIARSEDAAEEALYGGVMTPDFQPLGLLRAEMRRARRDLVSAQVGPDGTTVELEFFGPRGLR